jgi:hypothetical protein
MTTLEATAADLSSQGALVAELSRRLATHPLHASFLRVEHVRTFMEHHVWCVWDFMSLLKSIQRDLAPASWPWRPGHDVEGARLVNEITVGEETDLGPDGRPASHYAIYLDAMRECGANTGAIQGFVHELMRGRPWRAALLESNAPAASRDFTRTTLEICEASLPERIAAFTLGREEIIPATFRPLIEGLSRDPAQAAHVRTLVWYLDRHVKLDGDEHGPLAARLFRSHCLADATTRSRSLAAAIRSLTARTRLWDAVALELAPAI